MRSLPELSMVVASTAAVAYARDPHCLLILFLLGPFRSSFTGPKAWGVERGSRSLRVPSSRGTVVGAVPQP